MSNQGISIHGVSIQQILTKVKAQKSLFCYVVVAATVGVPQLAEVRYVELGGK